MGMRSDSTENRNSNYWYFRFSKQIFDDLKITQMTTLPNGYEMFYLLLQLYTLALEEHGYFSLPNIDGRPDYVALSKHTKHDIRIIEFSMQYFLSVGFLEMVEGIDKTIFYTPQLKNMIGKSSKDADRKRLEYAAQHNKLPDDEQTKKRSYGIFENVYLCEEEHQILQNRYRNADELINRVSAWKKQTGREYDSDYAAVIKFGMDDGIEETDQNLIKQILNERYDLREENEKK